MASYDLSRLIVQAECYNILSQLFEKPESGNHHGRRIFEKLLKNAGSLMPKELQLVKKLRNTIRNINFEEIESAYSSLFEGDYALAYPCSNFYLDQKDSTTVLQDCVQNFYQKTSFKNETSNLSDDHIVIELKFIHYLIQESIMAFRADNFENVSFYSCLHCEFIKEHMIKWIPDFTRQILNNSESPFYLQLSILTRTVLVNCKEQDIDS